MKNNLCYTIDPPTWQPIMIAIDKTDVIHYTVPPVGSGDGGNMFWLINNSPKITLRCRQMSHTVSRIRSIELYYP